MNPSANQKLDLDRLRQQDPSEFTAFVHQYQRMVLGMAQSLGLSGADCDDTAAETFTIAYRALRNFAAIRNSPRGCTALAIAPR